MDYTLVLVMSDGGHQSIECATAADVENHLINALRTRVLGPMAVAYPVKFATFTVIQNF